ncbi:elongation factor EF-2, partial [Candidatus Woesearchaeota archaeon]|nr:elongation factor EF-2 [Candidatus Woesearchaeota archaeon]
IRNICICAHTDHGKCISKNSRLYQPDGTLVNASDLFKKAVENGIKFEENEERVIYDLTKEDLSAFSLNKATGRIEKKQIQLAWKLKGGETIKTTLRNGFEITTTPEHKYIILEDNTFKDREARDLKLGDRVVCSRKLSVNNALNIKKEILERISNKNFYATFNVAFGKKLKNLILKNGLSSIKTSLKAKSLYHGAWQNRYQINDLMNLVRLFGLGIEEVYDNILAVNYRSGKQMGKSSSPMGLPQNFEEFYYLAGLFVGDGTNKKFVVGKEELSEKFVAICKKLNISLTFRDYGNRTPEIVTNMTLVQVLNSLFDYPLANKSHNVKISEFLFKSPDKYIAKFVKGYFDTDGCVEKARKTITISSASKQMIEDLHLLLVRFGCISIKEKDNTLTISGQSAINFAKTIGFGVNYKANKLKLLVEGINYSYVCDDVQAGNKFMCVKKLASTIINNDELAFIEVKRIEQTYEDEVYDFTIKDNHNFIAEGMVIHNTTFSDNLLAGAGMMSEELAGKQLALDFHADEIERGITIDSANVSMVHELDEGEFLINLIDTPGHVDFGGDVTRAMRAVDGAIVLCCAVEGIMPQTETVLKQALRERVKPILFINKVDRLIKEVKLTPERMQERFIEIITGVNAFIKSNAPEEFKEQWQVSVQDGSVGFGSAFHNWGLSFHYMKAHNLTFKDVITAYETDSSKELAKKAPLHKVILNMVVKHHPNPKQAQKYRIPKIWHGDIDSELGKALVNCDPNGEVAFVCTKIVIDKHAGEVAAGRLFSGTVRLGQEVYMNMAKKSVRLQQVSIYKGAQRIAIDEAPAGNIVGLVGLKGVFSGETVSINPIEPFEAIKHLFEPVVTKSIEAKTAADLPKLIDVLKQVGKEDPTIKIEINEETGENLMSGMGELHLEVIENRMRTEKGIDVITSPPIVVYRETINRKSGEKEGKSPNKHNKFYFVVEPLNPAVSAAIKDGELPEMRIKKKDDTTIKKFIALGFSAKEAKDVRQIYKGNMLVDSTKGIVYIGEVIELVMDGFEQVMDSGLLAKEPCMKVMVYLMDCKLHEDSIHRGPAQVLPAVREGIREALADAKPVIFEPMQTLQIEAPMEFMGEISKLVQNKRGQLQNMEQEGEHITVKAKLPVGEMFGLTSELRSATSGRGSFFIVDQSFEKLPESLQEKIIRQIKQRKGIKE